MTPLEKAIRDLTDESDIAFNGDVYQEIARGLTNIGLNLAFFVFKSSDHSHVARALEDGRTASFPSVTLYLKYDEDLRQTGIDRHRGNWDDEWGQTDRVRDAINVVLQRHNYGSDYVSERTFVFVATLEEIAFRDIGRECKNQVRDLVCAEAPGVDVTHVFWNGHQYYVIMRDKRDYQRVSPKVKDKIAKALPELLAASDTSGYCQAYKPTIEFGHTGMNLFTLMRDDL
jgi:hypothetical protein